MSLKGVLQSRMAEKTRFLSLKIKKLICNAYSPHILTNSTCIRV